MHHLILKRAVLSVQILVVLSLIPNKNKGMLCCTEDRGKGKKSVKKVVVEVYNV